MFEKLSSAVFRRLPLKVKSEASAVKPALFLVASRGLLSLLLISYDSSNIKSDWVDGSLENRLYFHRGRQNFTSSVYFSATACFGHVTGRPTRSVYTCLEGRDSRASSWMRLTASPFLCILKSGSTSAWRPMRPRDASSHLRFCQVIADCLFWAVTECVDRVTWLRWFDAHIKYTISVYNFNQYSNF